MEKASQPQLLALLLREAFFWSRRPRQLPMKSLNHRVALHLQAFLSTIRRSFLNEAIFRFKVCQLSFVFKGDLCEAYWLG